MQWQIDGLTSTWLSLNNDDSIADDDDVIVQYAHYMTMQHVTENIRGAEVVWLFSTWRWLMLWHLQLPRSVIIKQ